MLNHFLCACVHKMNCVLLLGYTNEHYTKRALKYIFLILPLWCMSLCANGQTYVKDRRIFAHKGGVQNIRFSPDGKLLASAGLKDFKIFIWDVESGEEKYQFVGHTDVIHEVTFDKSGQYLASASKDGTVKVWCLNSGQMVGEYFNKPVYGVGKKPFVAVSFVCFSIDNQFVFFGGENSYLYKAKLGRSESGDYYTAQRIFQANTYEKDHIKTITGGTITSDGLYILVSIDNFVQVIDWNKGELIKNFYYPFDYINDVVFSARHDQVSVWSYDGKVTSWIYSSGKLIRSVQVTAPKNYSTPSFSPNGKYMVSAAFGNKARVWKAGNNFAELDGHTDIVRIAKFSPVQHLIATAGYDGVIQFWKKKEFQQVYGSPVVLTPPPPIEEEKEESNKKKEDIYLFGEKVSLSKTFLLESVQFEKGVSDLTESSKGALKEIADFMHSNSSVQIEIHGHTDNVGHAIQNYQLSLQRAQVVQGYLVDLGISEGRIIVKAFGESKPLTDNSDEDERPLNRRVEIKIIKL